jgi:glycerol transport system ATP-binding protein
LRLVDVSYRSGSETWLHPLDFAPVEGEINVLLGATLAGKTTLMRVMAGLDRPTTGQLWVGERDVTGLSVRQRNLAMVYQQLINYPSLSVYENIASPLRIARKSEQQIKQRVGELAETLRLTPYLSRHPAELSGGQQQRTALARALAKDAELLLLDEPLVNLDYKLREDLREELAQLFSHGRTTVIYATTEPQEALQLGGNTAVLHEGRLLQFGPTLEVFRRPHIIAAARAFSDPPLNVIAARIDNGAALFADGIRVPLPPYSAPQLASIDGKIQLGIRAHEFSFERQAAAATAVTGRIDLAEISGSDTYLHLSRADLSFVAQFAGVHDFAIGAQCTLYLDPAALYGFDMNGKLLFAPAPLGTH